MAFAVTIGETMKHTLAWYFDYVMKVIKGPDFRTFIIFLAISFLVWSIERLRQSYTIDVDYGVTCVNVPDNYIVDENGIVAFRATVTGDGLDLMMMKPSRRRTIEVDVSKLRKTFVDGHSAAIFIPRKYTHEVMQSLPDHIALERVEIDTVYIPLLTRVKKVLPVIVTDNVTLESQHMFSGPRMLEPDTVWVSGTNDKIDTMTAVYTRPLEPIVLRDSISLSMEFDLPNGVEASARGAQVTYCVEPYTEKIISVPITAVNVPEGYTFRAFPQSVNVTLSLGLSNFDVVTSNDIDIVADLQDVKLGSNQQKIKVKLAEYPKYIRSISYSPIFVEYLLEHRHSETAKDKVEK